MNDHYYVKHRNFSRHSSLEVPERKSSLYESKVRRRLLRVLVDDGALKGAVASERLDALRGLVAHPLVKEWDYLLAGGERHDLAAVDNAKLNRLMHVRDTTGSQGPFAFPGLSFSYSYSESDEDEELVEHGWFNVDPLDETFARHEIPEPTEKRMGELRALLTLSKAADSLGADVVLTNRHVGSPFPLTNLGVSQFVTPAAAGAAVSHYLRTQGAFVVGVTPRKEVNSEYYYRQALHAYCPHLQHWKHKVIRAAEVSVGDAPNHVLYTRAVLTRFERSLRRFDDLLLHIGQPPTSTSVDDAVDTLDHILVSLCGGVDALARSLGTALGMKKARDAKLHVDKWLDTYLRPEYGHAPEYEILLSRLPALKFVFGMRNSIHEVALLPDFEGSSTDPDLLGRMQLTIPPSYRTDWEKLSEAESDLWRLRLDGNIVQVDLLHFAIKSLESVFSYVDALCELVSFEQVGDANGILYENIESVFTNDALEIPMFIAATGHLHSPLLDGSYNPHGKRKLDTDLRSVMVRYVTELARKSGMLGDDKFGFMDPDGEITAHYDRDNL